MYTCTVLKVYNSVWAKLEAHSNTLRWQASTRKRMSSIIKDVLLVAGAGAMRACILRPRPPQVPRSFFFNMSGARITTSTIFTPQITLPVATQGDYVAKWRKQPSSPRPSPEVSAQNATAHKVAAH